MRIDSSVTAGQDPTCWSNDREGRLGRAGLELADKVRGLQAALIRRDHGTCGFAESCPDP